MTLPLTLSERRPWRVPHLCDGHPQSSGPEVVGAHNGVPLAVAVVTRRSPALLAVDGAVEGGGQQPRRDDSGPAHGAPGAPTPHPDHPGEVLILGLVAPDDPLPRHPVMAPEAGHPALGRAAPLVL